MKWRYVLDGEEIAAFDWGKNETPYVGYSVTWVGRKGFGPVEEFVASAVDHDDRTITLRRAEGATP